MAKTTTTQARHKGALSTHEGMVLAVYAPFGTDELLSKYPNLTQVPVAQQALVLALQEVAKRGVNVSALIDLFDDDSYLVEIPAGKPKAISIISVWKQDMSTPQALAGFLRRTHQRFACSKLVLALEGHGGGFVPDIDSTRITPTSVTRSTNGQHVRWLRTENGSSFEPDDGSPVLPMESPELPMESPELPSSRLPLTTWALGEALRSAIKSGVPRPAVIHFNNCFNASVELLHTVAQHADFATGYANYDFFTAGQAYPQVFANLAANPGASNQQLAQWFATENGKALSQKPNHPTVGSTVDLARMPKVAKALDALAILLTKALVTGNRADVQKKIRVAAIAAQQFDTDADFALETPDQFTDIGSFALHLQKQFGGDIGIAAQALLNTLSGIKQYGDVGSPWMATSQSWNFSAKELGLNIFFPDPRLEGIWDWRSPYYLSGVVDPNKPPAHRHVIDFLADVKTGPLTTRKPFWVEFIIEYHKGGIARPFQSFKPALAPFFPVYDQKYDYQLPPKGGRPNDKPPGPNDPSTGIKR
jgi:hypothetical protein